jgi:hypothetical protein
VSYETIVNLIGNTKSLTGLQVTARLDTRVYATGERVSRARVGVLRVKRHAKLPQWNYTIRPHRKARLDRA